MSSAARTVALEVSASLEEASDASASVFAARFTPEQPGIYKVSARVRRGGTDAGSASSSFWSEAPTLVADPRLNTAVLSRLAAASGGRLLESGRTSHLLEALRANVPAQPSRSAATSGTTAGHSPRSLRSLQASGSCAGDGGSGEVRFGYRWVRGPLGLALVLVAGGAGVRRGDMRSSCLVPPAVRNMPRRHGMD